MNVIVSTTLKYITNKYTMSILVERLKMDFSSRVLSKTVPPISFHFPIASTNTLI